MIIDLSTLSLDQLKRVVAVKEQIEALESKLAGLLGAPNPAATVAPGKRSLSAATRAKMAAAHQARWAKIRAGKAAPQAPPAKGDQKPKRRLSAAGRAAIIAAAKARWAKIKAEGKAAPKAPAKRKMSAAGRARLVAAVKARWAKAKAAGKAKL